MLNIGVDVGGTTVKAGVVNEKGHILDKMSIPTGAERPYGQVIHDIASLCGLIAEKAGTPMEEIESIGIGVPGMCDMRTGIIPFCTNLGWRDVPFIEEMKRFTDKPIFVENDANVAGLAESVAGISSGVKSSVFITLGTGVGSGIILNGRIYTGAHGVAGEFGHTIIRLNGEPCSCGNKGCFERYASATAIIREARRAVAQHPESAILASCAGDPERIDAKVVIDCAKGGDETALAVFQGYARALAAGILNLVNILDPELFVLGGGVSMAGDFLLNAVRSELKEHIFYKSMPYGDICLASLGSDAGIIGAALLGWQAKA